jgi:ankyrin repeat protein
VVKLLFEAGADPTTLNNAGHDAVYEAEINGKEEVVGYLLARTNAVEKAGSAEGVEDSAVQDCQENGMEIGKEDGSPSMQEEGHGDIE